MAPNYYGARKIKCRRRATLSNTTPVTCRYKSWKWNDDDPTQRMCTYVKAGSRMDPPTVTMSSKIKEPAHESINVHETNDILRLFSFLTKKIDTLRGIVDYYQHHDE